MPWSHFEAWIDLLVLMAQPEAFALATFVIPPTKAL
jgi:hypothetical protein